jgi:hypothetical protein
MDDLLPTIVAWFDQQKMKGMVLDTEAQIYPFDSRNLGDLLPTDIYEGHIVTLQLRWRNSRAMVDIIMHPTREEAAEFGEQLRDVYEKNAIEQKLLKADLRATRRSNVEYYSSGLTSA